MSLVEFFERFFCVWILQYVTICNNLSPFKFTAPWLCQRPAPVRTTEMRKMHCSVFGGSGKVTKMASPTGNVERFFLKDVVHGEK